MNHKKNYSQLLNELMRTDAMKSLGEDTESEVYHKIMEIVEVARLEVIEDAEKAIAKLRVFSLR